MILLEKWEHISVPAVAQKAILIWMYMLSLIHIFHTEADFPEKTEEVEQIVRVEPQGYVGIYHADEE